jgi:hypothetical protein
VRAVRPAAQDRTSVTDTEPSAADDGPPVTAAETEGLPAPIAADLLEAGACCSFGAYRAAGLLARRAVEQAAVLCRVPLDRKTLAQKIGWLLAAGHVPGALRPQARTVAAVGAAAAHGGEALTRAEAYSVVTAALHVVSAALNARADTA